MKQTKFKSKVSLMGKKGKIINVPKAVEHLFDGGDDVVFYKEGEESERIENNKQE